MPAPTVVLGGTAEPFVNKPVEAFGTVLQFTGYTDALMTPPPGLVATSPGSTANQLQNAAIATQPVQTVNLFIGEFSRVYGLTPQASIVALISILSNFREQAYQ
jgi:hypothetical protein